MLSVDLHHDRRRAAAPKGGLAAPGGCEREANAAPWIVRFVQRAGHLHASDEVPAVGCGD